MNARTLLYPLALGAALSACGTTHHDGHYYMEAAATPSASGNSGAPADVMAEMMGEMSAEEQEMMGAWVPFMEPGSRHLGLSATAGTWNLELKQWMRPGAEAATSTAVSTFESFAGGRYLIERVEGGTPMGPFAGMGITGFNNRTGRYFNLWIDSMGTGVMSSEGEGDDKARLIHFKGTLDDPASGGTSVFRSERRVLDENSFLFVMWMEMDGQEFKGMEILYTRA